MAVFDIGVAIGAKVKKSFKSSLNFSKASIGDINTSIAKLQKTRFEIRDFGRLSKHADDNKDKLGELSKSLKKSGFDVKQLGKSTRALNLSLTNLKKLSKVKIDIEAKKEKFSQAKGSVLGVIGTAASFGAVAKIRANVLQAQGEIESLGVGAAGIEEITKAGKKLSLQYGQVTAPEFVKASYDIKSGIASLSDSGVAHMTRMASTTAVATKAS